MENIKKYYSQVKQDLTKQLEMLEHIEFPNIKKIELFNINDEILTEGAKSVREKYDLPPDGHQVIYLMYLEGFNNDRTKFNDVIDGIKNVKKEYRQELTQITSINNENFSYHQDREINNVVMYIGTSQKFASRVQTHAGHGSKGTATTCLKGWPVLKNESMKFSFNYYDFGKDVAPETLKFFEYYLSKDLRPLIGHNRRS